MAKILLLANLNCDRILRLDKPLQTGGRFQYQDGGLRLGGGGANTGIGLVWAGHNVAMVSDVGNDEIGDWILQQANSYGLDCDLVTRFEGCTCEMLLVMTPDGERTIIRPQRPSFELSNPPNWHEWQAMYVNSSAKGASAWCRNAIDTNPECLIVAQLAKDERERPCHVLIASITDMQGRCLGNPWAFALSIATSSLQYFIVTDGERGSTVYSAESSIHVPAINVDRVVDTTGAGDAYAAGVLHGLTSKLSITDAMIEGSRWAGFAVASQSSIPGAELQQYLNHMTT